MSRLALMLSVALISSACLRSTTVISLKQDGSGTILQETGISPQALALLQGMAGSGAQGRTPAQLFGEDQAKRAAATMGVQFVSGESIKSGQLEGYRARFAFDDIRKLRVRMNQDPTLAGGATAPERESPFGFDFERGASSSVLTIVMPEQKPGPAGMGPFGAAGGAAKDDQANQQAVQMMRIMMQGLFVDISLLVDGRILNTTAPYVNGSQLTLLQVDFDKLLADEAALQKLQGATDLKALTKLPGLKVIPDRRVRVEFAKAP